MSINSDDRPWPQALGHDDLDWPAGEPRVLVPFCEAANEHGTSLLGASITFGTDGELYILHATESDEAVDADRVRNEAAVERDIRDQFSVPVHRTEETYSTDLLDSFVRSHSITTAVVDREERRFFSWSQDDKTVTGDCHSVVGTGMDSFESPSSILVPVARGPHSGLATKVAGAISRAYDCWLELFHVVPDNATESEVVDADKLLDAYEYRLADDVEVDHHVVRAADTTDEIIEHAGYHDVTVLGAPRKGKLRRFLFGSTPDDVNRDIRSVPVLTAHRNTNESVFSRWF